MGVTVCDTERVPKQGKFCKLDNVIQASEVHIESKQKTTSDHGEIYI